NDDEFMDQGACQTFQELMEQVKQQGSRTYVKNMTGTMQQLRPEQLGEIKEMMTALNQMLRDRLEGKTPRFEQFMQRFGHFFGPDPPKTLDELIQHLEKQMAQMESLMQSLSPEMRQQMEELLASTLNDPELPEQMSELATQLEEKGYVQRGRRGMELTPRGMRRIGQKALRDLYTRLKRDRFGDHPITVRGLGSERSDETKVYEFGDAFNLDVEQT